MVDTRRAEWERRSTALQASRSADDGVHDRMPSLAIVQDALPFRGGAESTLEAILERAPDASLYTAVYCKPNFPDSPLAERTIRTSFIDRLPGARANHYRYAPLFPLAMESFDLRDNDAILSCSYGFAHGVLADPEQLHL